MEWDVHYTILWKETVVFFLTVSIITNKQHEDVAWNGELYGNQAAFKQSSELIYSYFRDSNWMDLFRIDRYSDQMKPFICKDSPINRKTVDSSLSFSRQFVTVSWYFVRAFVWISLIPSFRQCSISLRLNRLPQIQLLKHFNRNIEMNWS